MKIDSSNRTGTLTGSTASASSRTGKAGAQGARTASSSTQDNVTLSAASTQISALAAGISEASGFDAAKVESIKQAISEGRYTINPEAIADKLIASTRELLAQQNP